ncbi:MAG TPA: hypothetical protein PKL14_07395 [Holophaga sp.]|nr:hypothetical protein [Holophaga sp.]
MTDMLVKLYDIQDAQNRKVIERDGIFIKRAMALDKHLITKYVQEHFSDVCPGWV